MRVLLLCLVLGGCASRPSDYSTTSDPRELALARCKGEAAQQVGDHVIFAQSSAANQITRNRKLAELTDGCMARQGFVR